MSKEGFGVIDAKRCLRKRAKIVIARVGVICEASWGLHAKVCVDFDENDIEDERCKERAKGAAFGEAFFLGEGTEGVVRPAAPADVGFCVKRVKERDEWPEFVDAL